MPVFRQSQYTTTDATGQVVDLAAPLQDKRRNGRPQPWHLHRDQANLLAVAYRILGDEDRARRVDGCAPRLTFSVDEAGRMKLQNAWFCRIRLCPVCQWRRSLKVYGQTSQIIQAANASRPGGYQWIMLTLTVRNVDPDELPATLTHMAESWHRLIKIKRWTDAVVGWQRATEITHNVDPESTWYNTYHPHYHVLLCVESTYFNGRRYIPQAEWTAMWRAAARTEYDPMVDIRKIYGSTPAAIAEVSKYSTKPADYLTPWDVDAMADAVRVLSSALHRRRLLAYGGLCKELHAKLGLDDVDTGDLVHTDNAEETAAAEAALVAYSWVPGYRQYFRNIER